MSLELDGLWLGCVPFAEALARQREAEARLHADPSSPGSLFLLEHPPTITLGRHARPENILLPSDELRCRGIDVVRTDRGGDVTWHGPGQLVAYPVLPLRALRRTLKTYVCGLEHALMAVAARWGIDARREDGAVGVWVGKRKLAAIGLHVRRGVTTHGIALNVATNPADFETIHPCGFRDRGVTSLALEGVSVTLPEASFAFAEAFSREFGVRIHWRAAPPAPIATTPCSGLWQSPCST